MFDFLVELVGIEPTASSLRTTTVRQLISLTRLHFPAEYGPLRSNSTNQACRSLPHKLAQKNESSEKDFLSSHTGRNFKSMLMNLRSHEESIFPDDKPPHGWPWRQRKTRRMQVRWVIMHERTKCLEIKIGPNLDRANRSSLDSFRVSTILAP